MVSTDLPNTTSHSPPSSISIFPPHFFPIKQISYTFLIILLYLLPNFSLDLVILEISPTIWRLCNHGFPTTSSPALAQCGLQQLVLQWLITHVLEALLGQASGSFMPGCMRKP